MSSLSSRAVRTTALTMAGLSLITLTACRGGIKAPWRSTEAIVDTLPDIPPMTLEASGAKHLIVVRANSGGWSVHLDKEEIQPLGKRVYITVRRPDPAFIHTQALVDHRVLTDVPSSTPLEIVARVLDHGAKPNDRIYARVQPQSSLD